MAASVTQGWRETLTDSSITGRPLNIAGKGCEKGLGAHAPGEMVFKLDRQHRQFAAEVGVDDEGGPTESVVFGVLLDGKVDEQGAGPPRSARQAETTLAFLFSPREAQPALHYPPTNSMLKYWKAPRG